VIGTKVIDRKQLAAQLDEIRSRTKSSIELSTRSIDQSFLWLKATHRNLYAAQRSRELMSAMPKTRNSAAVASRALPDQPSKERAGALPSATTTASIVRPL
jgi:hypothetical protein